MSRILIRGGVVLTMGRVNHTEADVLIDDGVIAEVGPGLRARDAEVVDASAAIVMPGFVDGHRHTWRALWRNAGHPGPSDAVAAFSPDDVHAATLIGLLGALDAGITTVVDCSPFLDDARRAAVLQAHDEAGVAPLVATDRGGRPVDATGRVHLHVGEDLPAGSVAAMAGRGELGSGTTVVHATNLDESDLGAIGSAGAGVVLTAASDMADGRAVPPLQAIIDAGIRPGLGTDREHLAPGDAFAQMRAAISVQHATVFDRKLAGKAGLPRLLTTRDVIRWSTADGAAAIGRGDETGLLEPGRRADVIVLATDRPTIHPINDPIGAVVWGMDTSHVAWVIAGGRVVKRAGALVADVARARSLAAAARDRLVMAGGVR